MQRNLHNNLVYIINLIIFAMQSGTAMPLSDLSAGGTTGMSEQNKSFNIQENSRNHGRNNKHDCRAQSGNHPRIDRTQPAHNQQEFCTAINPNRSLEKVSCHFLMTAIRKIALYMLDS